jgi:hypothetical protein
MKFYIKTRFSKGNNNNIIIKGGMLIYFDELIKLLSCFIFYDVIFIK